MKETIDMLVPLSPFLLGLFALLIPSAADRLKFKREEAAQREASSQPSLEEPPPVVQGKTVDFAEEYVSEVKQRARDQRAKIAELERKLRNCTCGAARS